MEKANEESLAMFAEHTSSKGESGGKLTRLSLERR